MAQAEGLKKVMFVVILLNLLGKQNIDKLALVKNHHFDVLIINPKILMSSSEAVALLEDMKFTLLILHIVFNKGHCISEWGKFRKDYTHLGDYAP
ncbi:hypothetical protein BDN71DRAFT_1398476 [Pleurotus eryngii]|uniref:Uncharacterized protein n=1 Tax=Pleurotus eryngii TaxID=5323 RepID=A0A9P5ZRI3_PLEER|nr:hypothetical protein BDN71DRAFT_1398476 [Pleurotus eryngii]